PAVSFVPRCRPPDFFPFPEGHGSPAPCFLRFLPVPVPAALSASPAAEPPVLFSEPLQPAPSDAPSAVPDILPDLSPAGLSLFPHTAAGCFSAVPADVPLRLWRLRCGLTPFWKPAPAPLSPAPPAPL